MRPPLRSIEPCKLPVSIADARARRQWRPRASRAVRPLARLQAPEPERARHRAWSPGLAPSGRAASSAAAVTCLSAPPAAAPVPASASPAAACRQNIASRSARWPRARWREWCSYCRSLPVPCRCAPLHALAATPPRSLASSGQTAIQAPRVARPTHNHARPLVQAGFASRTISRRRRRTRLRSTAFADLFRHGEADAYRAVVAALARLQHETPSPEPCVPPAAARKSARCLNRSMEANVAAFIATASGAEPLASAPAPRRRAPCGRPWSPCVCENRGGACAPVCSVDRSASRLNSPLGRRGAGIG